MGRAGVGWWVAGVKGPVVVSSAPAAVLCKSTMAKEKGTGGKRPVHRTGLPGQAEAGGLRHGKRSSSPKRVRRFPSYCGDSKNETRARTGLNGLTRLFFLFFFLSSH